DSDIEDVPSESFQQTSNFTVSSNQTNDDMDAGYYRYATLGNFVWNDVNADGYNDDGEDGIGDLEMVLLNAAETVLDNQLTSKPTVLEPNIKLGYFEFTDLVPGDYILQYPTPDSSMATLLNYSVLDSIFDSDANPETGRSVVITLTSNMVDTSWDAGFVRWAVIGDTVWNDLNADGIQDAGEPGVANVAVSLVCPADALKNQTTTTDADGRYEFNTVFPGEYYVQFTKPATALNFVAAGQGSDAALDSDVDASGKTGNFTVVQSQKKLDMDAGLKFPGSIGNFVWDDANGNGVQDVGENGLVGVAVRLIDAGNPTLSATTDGSGSYVFENLEPGNYAVQFTLPTGYLPSPQNNSGDDETDSDISQTTYTTAEITIASSENNLSVDAGFYQASSIGDFVWEDQNADGRQDSGEPGMSGVTVRLLDGGTNSVISTTITNGSGLYAFTGLSFGNYRVEIVPPANYHVTIQNVGGNMTDSDVSPVDNRTVAFPLAIGKDYQTVDAGLFRYASVGDYVWNDDDYDGVQDGGETGIENVTVTLLNTDFTATGKSTTTDGTGAYSITEIVPGSYVLEFSEPAGLLPTLPYIGGNAVD
ncbi:hypothetical protein KAH55_11115, partial [bacterium]|nr:hypothetical protein [bacterium]